MSYLARLKSLCCLQVNDEDVNHTKIAPTIIKPAQPPPQPQVVILDGKHSPLSEAQPPLVPTSLAKATTEPTVPFTPWSDTSPTTTATMPPSTTAQRNATTEFINLTKADKTTASRYLKSHAYNVQNAINAYYNDGSSLPASGTRNDLSKLFDKYRGTPTDKDSTNTINMDGTQKYVGDLDVSIEDISFFILAEIVGSPAIGQIEREGFVDGWALHNASTLDRQRSFIATRKASLPTPASRDVLKRVYKHAFKMLLEPPKRSLDVETAIALWTTLFSAQGLHWQTGGTDWFELWCDFMTNKNKRPVNKDAWDQTFAFAEKTLEHGDVSFWSEDGAWPGVIDEFVEWFKAMQPAKEEGAMEIE